MCLCAAKDMLDQQSLWSSWPHKCQVCHPCYCIRTFVHLDACMDASMHGAQKGNGESFFERKRENKYH